MDDGNIQQGSSREHIQKRWRAALITFFVLMVVGTLATVVTKAIDGDTAFVRWMQDTERLHAGKNIYSTEHEGYPNLPIAALILSPFHALGPVAGSIVWHLLKCSVIAGILATVLWICRTSPASRPRPWLGFVLLLLSARVFIGDLTHGNLNLLIGGLIALTMLCLRKERDFLAGVCIGLAGTIKVTPLLFLPYFVLKRRWNALLGILVGVVLFAWLIPGLILGFDFNHALMTGWYQQMIHPFISGAVVDYAQTRHHNQSLTGVAYRLLCDTIAILSDTPNGLPGIRVNLLSLELATVSHLLKGVYVITLGVLAWSCRTPRTERTHLGHLGEFALVFLAMLMISERSWKHHFVLLILAHACIIQHITTTAISKSQSWVLVGLLIASIVFHQLFTGGIIGARASDFAEAYGVYLWGNICLFVACAIVLHQHTRVEGPAAGNIGRGQSGP